MRNFYFLALTTLLSIITLNAQEKTKQKELEYPFAEPGTKVTRGVFGSDDRKEVKDAEGYEDFVRATAVMISKDNIHNDEFHTWSLKDLLKQQFNTDKFDPNVKFLDQPTVGSCSGFLIAPDILVTAGHCINSMEDANRYVWVFDYTSESDFIDGNRLKFKSENIYEVESIIASELDNQTDDDYAVLKLKRKSTRAPYRFRTSGTVLENSEINTLGCPTGLPLKFATNAIVIDNSPDNWFKSDIDAFPGNSGGPVFDKYGFIEGILVRGAVEYDGRRYTGDYKYDEECDCVKTVQWEKVGYSAGCQSHKITAMPTDVLTQAIYENIKYAIENNLADRFKTWSIYNWIFNSNYANQNGRLEQIAIENNKKNALKTILEITAKDISDQQSRILIDLAINKNDIDALKAILDAGILADAGLNSNYSAVQNAVKEDKTDIVENLIYYGADFKIKTINGDTLLHLAAKNGSLNMVKLLLKNGLDANTKNNQKKRPEQLAKKAKHKLLAKYLKKARKGRL